jgi:hypothetical protein
MATGKRSYFEDGIEIHEVSQKSALSYCGREIREFARDAYGIKPVRGKKPNGYPSRTLGGLGITIVKARAEGYEWSFGKTKEEAISEARDAAGMPPAKKSRPAPATAKVSRKTANPTDRPGFQAGDLNVLMCRLNIGGKPIQIETNSERALSVALSTLVGMSPQPTEESEPVEDEGSGLVVTSDDDSLSMNPRLQEMID